jgi:hypothetical protein
MAKVNAFYNIDVLKPDIAYIVAEKDLANKANAEKARPSV